MPHILIGNFRRVILISGDVVGVTMILVTGGAGYIGSHCALKLMEAGEDVKVFDSLELGTQHALDVLGREFPDRFKGFVKGDLKEPEDIRRAVTEDVEAVVHFAAYSQVAESMRNPRRYYENNVIGTINLLGAMADAGVGMIVFSSTAATYGEPVYTPIDEEHPKAPINPYGATKLIAERIMQDYEKHGIRSARLRYFNVAGADPKGRLGECHDPETHLIPNVLKAAGTGKEFSMFGTDYDTRDGTCVRDYIDVNDLAEAHVLALRYLRNGGRTDCFNLGTNGGSTVREVFAVCRDVVGEDIPLKECLRREGDPAVLVADNRKAREVLGWEPKSTLRDSVARAWAWERTRP